MLQLLLQRERDLRDTSLPDVVVELALITAAQLPHLAPLDALLKAGPAAAASAPRAAAPQAVQAQAAPRPPVHQAPLPVPATPVPAMPAPRPALTPIQAVPAVTPMAAPAPAEPPAPLPRAVLQPIQDPTSLEQLRKGCTDALKQAPGGLPRTLGSLPHMASALTFQGGELHWRFPPNVRNTVQDLEREQGNPHLLGALRQVLPGLTRLVISFEADAQAGPEEALRADPSFQRLLTETGGEIVEIRQPK
jgi:hypothetical protein